MVRLTIMALGAFALTGCATAPAVPHVWIRTDGRRMQEDAALLQQGQIDQAICLGETQKSAVGMAPIYYQGIAGAVEAQLIENQRSDALAQVAQGCMAQRGYVYVPADQADSVAAQLRATAGARAKLAR